LTEQPAGETDDAALDEQKCGGRGEHACPAARGRGVAVPVLDGRDNQVGLEGSNAQCGSVTEQVEPVAVAEGGAGEPGGDGFGEVASGPGASGGARPLLCGLILLAGQHLEGGLPAEGVCSEVVAQSAGTAAIIIATAVPAGECSAWIHPCAAYPAWPPRGRQNLCPRQVMALQPVRG
jgi:hypothetical protein